VIKKLMEKEGLHVSDLQNHLSIKILIDWVRVLMIMNDTYHLSWKIA